MIVAAVAVAFAFPEVKISSFGANNVSIMLSHAELIYEYKL